MRNLLLFLPTKPTYQRPTQRRQRASDGTEMVRLLLSKGADPTQLDAAKINVAELNCTMRYWIAVATATPPPTPEDLEHLAKTPPMHKMHEIKYSLIGQDIACEMVKRALTARFGNPRGRNSPLVMLLLGPPGHGKT